MKAKQDASNPMFQTKSINNDKLPSTYGQVLQTNFSEPIMEEGEIFKTMQKLKLEYKFNKSFKKKIGEAIDAVYQEAKEKEKVMSGRTSKQGRASKQT